MAHRYTLEEFAEMPSSQMNQLYEYYNLQKGNLTNLITKLDENKRLAEQDLPYFRALQGPTLATLLTFNSSDIYQLINKYLNVQPGASKALYIRRIVDSNSLDLIKQAINSTMSNPQRNRLRFQPPPPVPQPSFIPRSFRGPTTIGQPPPALRGNQPRPVNAPAFPITPPSQRERSRPPEVTQRRTPEAVEDFPQILPPSPPQSPGSVASQLTLRKIDLNVQAVDLREEGVQFESIPQYTITYPELVQVIENQEFIRNYIDSLEKLYREKYIFYNRILKQMRTETEEIRKEFNEIKRLDTSAKMSELYPQYKTFLLMVTELKNIIQMIRKQLNDGFSIQKVQEGLRNGLLDSKKGLDSIVGRENIKNTLAEIIYSFSKNYRTFSEMFNNFAIYGPAGVGKTRTATIVAYVFHEAYLLLKENLQVVTRADLVSQWIGGTAPQTRSILLRSLESVLFVDEAYELPPEPDSTRDHGREAITEIVNFLDKYIGKNIVIVAGYQKPMEERFMASNEGLPRRFPNVVVLQSYSNEELTLILVKNIRERSNVLIDDETGSYLFSLISLIRAETPRAFKNQAGDMLNLASSILRNIGAAYQRDWINGDLQNNIPLILSGFNDFLRSKDIQVGIE
jgi:hypothetical protein